MFDSFFKFLKTSGISLGPDKPVLLAVSGGMDSVVLAHLFQRSQFPFAIAHCNFQLRDEESDEDELFVQNIALEYECPFFIKRFETREYARQNGISIQMAARELRYSWFEEIAAENGYTFIATAHQLNDNVETVLLNFTRGSGLPGLTGMLPISGNLIRPMLFAGRKEIADYAKVYELSWREDSSNFSDDYNRNFLRRHVIPLLEQLNPGFMRTAERNLTRLSDAQDNLMFLLQQWLLPKDGVTPLVVEKATLNQLPSPRHALREWLRPYGFDAEQSRQVADNMDHIGLEIKSLSGWRLLVDRDKLLLQDSEPLPGANTTQQESEFIRIHPDDLMLRLPDGSGLFFTPQNGAQTPDPDPNCAIIDASNLKYPLFLRHWQPGDTFKPLGMAGKRQKLQDFFTNQKLSRFEKEAVWLLVNGDGAVIWVLGLRLDERFKLRPNSSHTIKIIWIK